MQEQEIVYEKREKDFENEKPEDFLNNHDEYLIKMEHYKEIFIGNIGVKVPWPFDFINKNASKLKDLNQPEFCFSRIFQAENIIYFW